MPTRVLVAVSEGGDELVEALREAGTRVERCGPERVSEAARAADPDVCLLEIGPESPTTAVRELTNGGRGPALLVLGSERHPDAAAAALRAGALGLLPREAPLALLAAAVERGARASALARELAGRRRASGRTDELVFRGESALARQLGEAVERVASTPRTTILISGERGTGKAAVARAVHLGSARAEGPLLELRAADIQDAEALRRVFGAGRGEHGLVGRAEGGTLVLEGVERLPGEGQRALSELLGERAAEASATDLRLIACTQADLGARVEAGRFREDLCYRLNVLTLRVPSLAERPEDIPELARGALERAADDLGRPELRLGDDLAASLATRAWPGNLRELCLFVERAALTSSEPLLGLGGEPAATPRAPSPAGAAAAEGLSPSLPLRDLSLRTAEEALIRRVMQETGGNKLRSAEILGIHRTTLYQKLKGFGIE